VDDERDLYDFARLRFLGIDARECGVEVMGLDHPSNLLGGGGRFGPKTDVHTKEDADHRLPYLLAVALLDVQTAQLNPEQIAKADAKAFSSRSD
jgi:2-methylcitrate dehydratase PrpD